MINISKGNFIILLIIVTIMSFIIGTIFGCSLTPGSIVKTETKVVTEPCEHVNLDNAALLQHSIIYHCDRDCKHPTQRILYDENNDITFIYTYYWKTEDGYSHNLYLTNTEILQINSDGSSKIIK